MVEIRRGPDVEWTFEGGPMVEIRRGPDVEWTFEGGPNYLSVQ